MAHVKGIYGDGSGGSKKKKTPASTNTKPIATPVPVKPSATKPVATPVPAKPSTTKPVVTPAPAKPATVNVPAQTYNDARQEQIRDQQYRKQQSSPLNNTTGTVTAQSVSAAQAQREATLPAQSYNDARKEQLREQQYRNSQKKTYYTPPVKKETPSDPLDSRWLAEAKARAEAAWEKWLWETENIHQYDLVDFYRQAGIPLPDEPTFLGKTPTLSQLYKDVQRRVSDLRSGRASELFFGMTDEEFLNEWYKDDPEWQKSHQNADAARKEQRAAKDYREKQEKAQRARDLSTQAAINEKFAVRDYLASQPGKEYTEGEKETQKFWDWLSKNDSVYSPHADLVASIRARNEREQRAKIAEESSTQAAMDEKLAEKRHWNKFAAEEYAKDNKTAIGSGALYNEHTGQIYIPASKENKTGTWEAYSMKGKIHVDPKIERKFSMLSNGLASLMSGGAIVTSKPTARMLQPVIANLIEAGMLSAYYQEQDYVLSNPRTNEVGLSLTGSLGRHGGGTVSLATDCYGNVAILCSLEKGVSTSPNLSLNISHTQTNAPYVDDLAGNSNAVGGSVDIPGVSIPGIMGVGVGADIIGFSNSYTGKGYYGVSVNGGVSLSALPAEFHAKSTETTIKHMVNLIDSIYPK